MLRFQPLVLVASGEESVAIVHGDALSPRLLMLLMLRILLMLMPLMLLDVAATTSSDGHALSLRMLL